jgi:hypothetical protein
MRRCGKIGLVLLAVMALGAGTYAAKQHVKTRDCCSMPECPVACRY